MICFPLDNTQYEAKDMGAYLATRTRGVFSADDNLKVSPGQSGLSVTVSPGLVWHKWSQFWGVAAVQEKALTLTLDAADGALKRIDAIVSRLNKTNNRAEIVVKKGSFSSAPSVAAPVRDESADEVYLATVLVEAGAVSIRAAAITDQRLNEEYCGLMRDGVTGIPTAALHEQARQLIDQLRKVIAGIEAGSEVMLKAAYDTDGNGCVDDADKLAGHTPAWYAPPGMITPYAGKTAPAGWLLCDGREVLRASYPALFAAIGTTFGAGDGKASFHLPDLRGRVAAGVSSGHALASKEGEREHTLTAEEMPKHSHNWAGWAGPFDTNGQYSGLGAFKGGTWSVVKGKNITYDGGAGIGDVGGGKPHNTMQPTMYLNYIIKT